MSITDNQIESSLKLYFVNELIVPSDPSFAWDFLEHNFPIKGDGINWNSIEDRWMVRVDEVDDKMASVLDFLLKMKDYFPEIINEHVVAVSDLGFDRSYSMKFGLFIDHYKMFMDYPHHFYLIFTKSRQLLNYTFEDDLCFGPVLRR